MGRKPLTDGHSTSEKIGFFLKKKNFFDFRYFDKIDFEPKSRNFFYWNQTFSGALRSEKKKNCYFRTNFRTGDFPDFGLPTSDFRTSRPRAFPVNFGLRTSDFHFRTSDFGNLPFFFSACQFLVKMSVMLIANRVYVKKGIV